MRGEARKIREIRPGQVWKSLAADGQPVAHVLEIKRDGFVTVQFLRSRVQSDIRISRFDGKTGGMKFLRDELTDFEKRQLAAPVLEKRWADKIVPGTGARRPRMRRRTAA